MVSACVICLSNLATAALYRCTTCHSGKNEASSVEFLCEDCLVPHIRKGHSVIDSKGDEPLTCTEHGFLCLQYCKSCNIPFCCKCLQIHSEHKFQSMDGKASEVRAEVFEVLTELESKEKPLRVKQETLSNALQKNIGLIGYHP